MTYRERYDPEDIEVLLSERGFDELLPEERAYVLRHLSGREEYEAMRATLQQIRAQDQRRQPIEPDAYVRNAVLAAFGERHSTGWRYHLNAVGAWLFPPDARAVFRPTLVLGGLALLVATVVWVLPTALEQTPGPLAEVKTTQEQTTTTGSADKEVASEAEVATAQIEEHDSEASADLEETRTMVAEVPQRSHEAETRVRDSGLEQGMARMDGPYEVADADHAREAHEDLPVMAMDRTVEPAARAEGYAVPPIAEESREVRMQELSMNMTTADGTVAKAAKQRATVSMSRPLATDADLLGLLTAAW